MASRYKAVVPSNYPINLIDVSVAENCENFSWRHFRIERRGETRDVPEPVVSPAAGCQGGAGGPAQPEHHQPQHGGGEDGELALATVQPGVRGGEGDGGEAVPLPLPLPRPQCAQCRELQQWQPEPAAHQHPEQPQTRLDCSHHARGPTVLLQVRIFQFISPHTDSSPHILTQEMMSTHRNYYCNL